MARLSKGEIQISSAVADAVLVERRRGQIIRAATKLFASRGFHTTTIKDIAGLADVSAGTIYQYFEEKHDILFLAIRFVVEDKLRRLRKVIDENDKPTDKLSAVIREYMIINDEQHAAVILIYREIQCLPRHYITELQSLEIRTNGLIAEAVQSGIDSKDFQAVNVELISHMIVALAQSWATKYWRLKSQFTLDEYIGQSTKLLLDAVAKPSRETR